MSLNSKFENALQKLEEVKKNIINDKTLLPISFTTTSGEQVISVDSLKEQFSKIQSAPFTIAVCGDVKAGKSTLLNAILFEDNILPTFDTPLTAKLTFIKKSDQDYNYFKANFYSKEEWDAVYNSTDDAFKEAFEKNMQITAERNQVYRDNCIGAVSKCNVVKDLEKLEEYVSAINEDDESSSAGKFTPYVRDVEIFINDERLKDLQIVDTPGLNDPNYINSRETTNWINNAHAIIYLVKGKGFDVPDFKFFQQFMAGRGPKYRIMVQNKIDAMKNYQDSFDYMKNLGTKPDYRRYNLFSKEETICSYSGLQVLIKKKESHGFPLTEDEEYSKKEGDFDPHQLEKKISEKLFYNEGAGRIESAFNVLNQVYEINSLRIDSDIESFNSKIEDFGTDKKDLEEKRCKLQDQKLEFDDNINEKRCQKIQPNIKDASIKMECLINDDIRRIKKCFKEKIDEKMSEGNYKDVVNYFPSIWTDELTSENTSLILWMNHRLAKFNEILVGVSEELRIDIQRVLNKRYIPKFHPENDENWKLPQNIEESLGFGEVLPKNAFTNLFHNNKTLSGEIFREVEKNLDEHYRKKIKELPNLFEDALKKRSDNFFEYIASQISALEKQLEESIQNYNNKEKEICKLNDEIKNHREKQALLKQKQIELQQMVKEICK